MYPEIGSYDAKTRLPELLREIADGHAYTITLRGRPVADLVPSASAGHADATAAVEAMRAMPKVHVPKGEKLQDWIAQGRQ
jgi:prevent-host-death family protein